jgi:hypothetical protein
MTDKASLLRVSADLVKNFTKSSGRVYDFQDTVTDAPPSSITPSASAQVLVIELQFKARRRAYGAEVVDLATLPEPPPFRIVLTPAVPIRTHLGIDAQVDGKINKISEFRTRRVHALDDDQLSSRNDLPT